MYQLYEFRVVLLYSIIFSLFHMRLGQFSQLVAPSHPTKARTHLLTTKNVSKMHAQLFIIEVKLLIPLVENHYYFCKAF